jgi:hypothetical protein
MTSAGGNNVCAIIGEGLHDRKTDAAAGARYDSDLPL